MKAIARFTPTAERDVDAIAEYIAQDSLTAALRFHVAVRRAGDVLATMPRMGAVYGLKRARFADVRFWPIKGFRKYLLFYRPERNGVLILRVIHGARDVNAEFRSASP
ncbi:MAG TPA: type II toxin-antitoxin system RelE/ParE family toxin [Tepidisphaeraceae bacterium]|jgi:toxin ParE1/3/4